MRSSASDSAVRSPRLAASRRSARIRAWLTREGGVRAISAGWRGRRSLAAPADADLVALAVGVVRLNRELAIEQLGEPREVLLTVTFEIARDIGMHADEDLTVVLGLPRSRDLGLHRPVDLGRQRRVRLGHPAPAAGGALRGQQRAEILANALARHLDEAELRDLEHVRPGLVVDERLPERPVDLLPVLLPLHVDEVDDDYAAEAPEPALPA